MSRFDGGISLTIRPPMRISPAVMSARPAIIRKAVVLPQPDGPTRTKNYPVSDIQVEVRERVRAVTEPLGQADQADISHASALDPHAGPLPSRCSEPYHRPLARNAEDQGRTTMFRVRPPSYT